MLVTMEIKKLREGSCLGPDTVDIGVVKEEERLIGRSSGTHITEDDAVNYRHVSICRSKVHGDDVL